MTEQEQRIAKIAAAIAVGGILVYFIARSRSAAPPISLPPDLSPGKTPTVAAPMATVLGVRYEFRIVSAHLAVSDTGEAELDNNIRNAVHRVYLNLGGVPVGRWVASPTITSDNGIISGTTTVVVPFEITVQGNTDALARTIADRLSAQLSNIDRIGDLQSVSWSSVTVRRI